MKSIKLKEYLPVKQLIENKIDETEGSNLKGDYKNIALLLLLYTIQGVPQGIASAIPILLQNRGSSYSDQAKFSIAAFPAGLKLLWAPVVDSIFIKSFGRRKSWICSSQIIIGIFMMYLSSNAEIWLGNGEIIKPQITILTSVFFILILFTTVQDIAVDGWGLTLLQRRNIGYAATTNSVGYSAGRFIGFIVLLVFESKEFCNKYIFNEPRETGLFTLSGFFMFWACVYIVLTTLVALFKYENPENAEQLKEHSEYGICKAYLILFKIIKLRPVIELYSMIFSLEACFAAMEAILPLKLIEFGVPKEKFALLSIPSAPVQILFPFLIAKYTTGDKPLSFYYKIFICRFIVMIVTTIYASRTSEMLLDENLITYFYVGIVILFMIDQANIRGTYTSDGSFFAKIADPLVGGSYMTLLNTFGNFSKRLFTTISLWLIDKLTLRRCILKKTISDENFSSTHLFNNTCTNNLEKIDCNDNGGTCKTEVDGFYLEIALSVLACIIWMNVFKPVIYRLQRYPRDDWFVLSKRENSNNVEIGINKN